MPIEIRETVKRREAKLPYGDVLREVRSVPRMAVTMTPTNAIVPLSGGDQDAPQMSRSRCSTTPRRRPPARCAQDAGRLDVGAGVAAVLVRASGRARVVSVHGDGRGRSTRSRTDRGGGDGRAGKEYREGYELIDHRDLEVRYLYRAVDRRSARRRT